MSDQIINEILQSRNIAVVGVSRSRNGFGFLVQQTLTKSGYNVFCVNKNASNVDVSKLFENLSAIHTKPDSIITVVPPKETLNILAEAASLGITKVWLQPGSDSEEVKQFCIKNQIQFVSGECIIMYMKDIGFIHRMHKWIHNKFQHRVEVAS